MSPRRTYVTNDGQRYAACNAASLVRQLQADSKTGADTSKEDWRLDAAYRASQATGTTVRGDSDAHLVSDLINAGLIKETGE